MVAKNEVCQYIMYIYDIYTIYGKTVLNTKITTKRY